MVPFSPVIVVAILLALFVAGVRIIQEYERGGITTSAKKSVDRALDALTSRGMYESDDLRGRS